MDLSFNVNVVTANVNFPGYSYLHLVDDMLNSNGKFRRKYLGCFYLGRKGALGEKLKRDVKDDVHIQYTNWSDRSKMISEEFKSCGADFIVIQETNLQMMEDMGLKDQEKVYAPYVLDIGDKKLESRLERGTAVVCCSNTWKMVKSFEFAHNIVKKGKNQTRKSACGVFFNEFLKIRIIVSSIQLTGYNPRSSNTDDYHFGDDELITYLKQIDIFAEEHGCLMAVIGGDFNQDLKTGDHADDGEKQVKKRNQILSDFEYSFNNSFCNVPTVKSKRCLDYIAYKHYLKLTEHIHKIVTGIKTAAIGDPNMSDHRFVQSTIELSQEHLKGQQSDSHVQNSRLVAFLE